MLDAHMLRLVNQLGESPEIVWNGQLKTRAQLYPP